MDSSIAQLFEWPGRAADIRARLTRLFDAGRRPPSPPWGKRRPEPASFTAVQNSDVVVSIEALASAGTPQ